MDRYLSPKLDVNPFNEMMSTDGRMHDGLARHDSSCVVQYHKAELRKPSVAKGYSPRPFNFLYFKCC